MSSPRLYAETLRHLKAQQILGRLWVRFYRPRMDARPAPSLRCRSENWVAGPKRTIRMTGPADVCFLNQKANISRPGIWEDTEKPKLWLYNLHYFDDLVAEHADVRLDWHRALIDRWIVENKPAHGTGWEPYPTSLRIVNWVKWCLRRGQCDDGLLHSLAIQARYLSRRLEYHILGNHLLANAKALMFAGALFDGKEADVWLAKGGKILAREIEAQVLADGGHFELSPMYHLIVLEDLLDCYNLCQTYDLPLWPNLETAIERMLVWSRTMRHPDGEIPFFNDAAFGVAPRPAELDAYASRLGFRIPNETTEPVVHLQASGYARLQAGKAVLFTDVAPVGPDYLPGHAHADTLSFELSLAGQRVVVNGGTSVYGTGPERHRQRGTSAHSTLVMDDSDSSEVWGGFRVARRARILNGMTAETDGAAVACASHDGYRRLPGRPIHKRTWRLSSGGLEVEDEVRGNGRHKLELMFHLHPDVDVHEEQGMMRLCLPGSDIVIKVLPPAKTQASIFESTWQPEFGLAIPSRSLRFSAIANLPERLVTRLHWQGV